MSVKWGLRRCLAQTPTAGIAVACDVFMAKDTHGTRECAAGKFNCNWVRRTTRLGVYIFSTTSWRCSYTMPRSPEHTSLETLGSSSSSTIPGFGLSGSVLSRCGWLLQRRGLPSRTQWGCFFPTVSGKSVVDFLKERKWNPESRT